MINTQKSHRNLWLPLYRFLTFSLADESISIKRLMAVSIEDGYLSIATGVRVLSRIRIKDTKRYHTGEDRYPNHSEVISSIRSFLNETGTEKSDIVLCIPKQWTVIKSASFPSSVKENLPGVISYEMDRLTPFSADEAFYDFTVLHEDTERVNVLLVTIRADLLMPYINALKENGFNITTITTGHSSMGSLLRYTGEDTECFLMTMVDGRGYECGLFIDGLMCEAYAERFKEGVNGELLTSDINTLVEHAKTAGRPPRLIMLINGNEDIKKGVESATGMPVRMIDKTRFENYGGDACIASAGVVESLWKGARSLNLLKKGYTTDEKPPYIITIVLVLILLVSIVFYILAPLKMEGKRLREIDRMIAEKEDAVKKVESIKKEIDVIESELSVINDFRHSRLPTIDILRELSSVLPKKAWLTGLSIKEKTLEIDGYSTSATELLPILDASRVFEKVEFSSPTVRDASMNSERFRIRMQIEGKSDAKK